MMEVQELLSLTNIKLETDSDLQKVSHTALSKIRAETWIQVF